MFSFDFVSKLHLWCCVFIFGFFSEVICSTAECNFVSYYPNATDTLLPTDVCLIQRFNNIFTSRMYKCISSEEVNLLQWNGAENCTGDRYIIGEKYKSKDGWIIQCNGTDCSATFRQYFSCDTQNSDFQDSGVVMSTCMADEKSNSSSIWATCDTNSIVEKVYDSDECAGKVVNSGTITFIFRKTLLGLFTLKKNAAIFVCLFHFFYTFTYTFQKSNQTSKLISTKSWRFIFKNFVIDHPSLEMSKSTIASYSNGWEKYIEKCVALGFTKVTIISRTDFSPIAYTSAQDVATAWKDPDTIASSNDSSSKKDGTKDPAMINENQELLDFGKVRASDGTITHKNTICFYGKKFKILQILEDGNALLCLKGKEILCLYQFRTIWFIVYCEIQSRKSTTSNVSGSNESTSSNGKFAGLSDAFDQVMKSCWQLLKDANI
ncbi:hypothetical protein RFI_21447 [Reticulomyxa filosa]|uniref:Uncharacterized protein n=1 Tax=Reticulomyxa filosa TaxID=46433 RepID=X6MPL3_RETFI|nr:hypothetical protein RFI_21447 [Reticulomyxa filosa]|eukprot:ETO15918.1 hypothetical protein RFI_21447 [Reticulomyxa filosa]